MSKGKNTLRALVVDDEPELRAELGQTLGAMGFELELCIDAQSSAKRAASERFALACVNLNLPRGSGYEVCEALRREPLQEGIRILVMSERHTPEDIAFAEEAGADAFLRRPFSIEELERVLRALMEPVPSKRSRQP